MRFLISLLLVAALAYGAWPYLHLYRLDGAITDNDLGAINGLVDLERVRANHQAQTEWRLEHGIDSTVGGEGALADMLKRSARWVSERTAPEAIDGAWVRERLLAARPNAIGSLLQNTDFAFLEGPNHFLVRLGELGRDPTHLRFERRSWHWVLTGIYD